MVTMALATPFFSPSSRVSSGPFSPQTPRSLVRFKAGTSGAAPARRIAAREILPRAEPVEPPAVYPEDALSYLANVYNQPAHDFYAKHGVKVIEAAYESHEELGEVSLMITKHRVRWSMSLCPKQAKGVTGVQGTVREVSGGGATVDSEARQGDNRLIRNAVAELEL